MAIGNGSNFKTKKAAFTLGYGMIIDLANELPRKFDEETMGDVTDKGFTVTGKVISILGPSENTIAPQPNETVNITIRPADTRKAIFDDMVKTNEGTRFLFEGVSGNVDSLEARWVHGAGSNRDIQALEIVGAPRLTFENPVPDDGPRNGTLRLNLDGTPTSFDVRLSEGYWTTNELPYETVVDRLKTALDTGLNFRVTQRVLKPSKAVLIKNGQDELEDVLHAFRKLGYTSCVVRTFIHGTTDPSEVDVQVLSWPADIDANATSPAKTYDMPTLKETKKFAALRDGQASAYMEIIPGFEINLVGNPSDASKSVKHKFVQDVVKGLSSAQKNLYATQLYGPGISIRAVNEDGTILGLTRLITRTEGTQYKNLMQIPTVNFINADQINFSTQQKPVDPIEEAAVTN